MAKQTKSDTFTAAEKAAMKERAREQKREARMARDRAAGEAALLEKIAEMPDADRVIAERVHEIVSATAPDLMPRTWYGMPAYARDGKVVCFFQGATKFEARYATLGFTDTAGLDDGPMWPTAFALVDLTPDVEARIADLVRIATG